MFEGIEYLWLKEIKRKDYLPREYFGLMKDLFAYRVPQIIKLALDKFPIVRNLYKKWKSVPKHQYKAFARISNGKYDMVKELRAWRATALNCSAHMQRVAKGSLCALCHTQGYKRFSGDVYTNPRTSKKKDIVYVPKVDVYDWMQACYTHIKNTEDMFEFWWDAVEVIKWKVPSAGVILDRLRPRKTPTKYKK